MRPLLTVSYAQGIYLPEPGLWLDPHFGVERAFVSHAHSDHVARHRSTLCSPLTWELMKERYGMGKDAAVTTLPFREPLEQDGWRYHLLPAGHIAGSAMLHLTRLEDGASLLYTGDYKLRQGLSSERCELLPADTLIMETTFGLPMYRFQPTGEIIRSILKWVRETLDEGGIPVLLGYSLGKAQEVLCALADAGLPVMLHKSVLEMTEVLAAHLGDLPKFRLFDPAEAHGHVLVFPPSGARSLAIRKLKVCRTAMLSGWAMQSGAKYRYQVDEAFPLSDHADYPELLETVETVKPRRTYLVHGFTREFGVDLRARGYEAWTLEGSDQLEMLLDTSVPQQHPGTQPQSAAQTLAAETDTGNEAPAASLPADSFAAWAQVCSRAAEESSRLKKVALLADYLRALDHEQDLEKAVRYCSGLLFDPAGHEGPVNTGWAIMKRALQELSGLRDAEYRVLSRSQADAGRTAYLVLGRAPLEAPEPFDLKMTDQLFRALREARGPQPKTRLLKERLARLDAHSGSWLIRLLTGELRMGSKEGLIEEAVASAFDQKADDVREAAMLSGDIGHAAVLARRAALQEAKPRPFVPLKVMLASPEETASDIWERLADQEGRSGVWLEDKYDGIRAQLHATQGRVEIYTRDLKPIGLQFPEVSRAAQALENEVILDGEIIAYAEDKKLSFFDLQKRLGRRDQADLFLPSDITVRYVVFDLLWKNGTSLLALPLEERRKLLEALPLPPGMALIDVRQAGSEADIEAAFMAARRRNNEGLIAKDPASPYSPGRRGKSWLKLKKAFATLDVVVVKAEQGHGKRSHVLSDYTFAVRDEHGTLRTIGKAYSGLTDAEIETLTEHFTSTTLAQKGHVRTVVPDTVLEIAFDSIQPSDRHDSGLAMRFPRIKGIRQDKTVAEIDTLDYARKLAGVSG
ncbi:MAG TPA: ATP-dependent DNA ligase [Prosthecobacter sp.]